MGEFQTLILDFKRRRKSIRTLMPSHCSAIH